MKGVFLMTNFNACEQDHNDPLGFIDQLAAASAEPSLAELPEPERTAAIARALGVAVAYPVHNHTLLGFITGTVVIDRQHPINIYKEEA